MWTDQADPRSGESTQDSLDRVSSCVVSKAVLLLSQLDGGVPVGLASLVRSSDMPKSTVRRILETLCFKGMANHTDGGYTLGPLAARLGQKAVAVLPEPALLLVMPHLLLLHEATHGVVCLGILCGTEVNCLQTLHRETDVPLARRLSRTAPAGQVALGRALLGQQPDETHIDIHNRLVVLATAITDHLNRPLASIAVAGPGGRFTVKSATMHLRAAAVNATRVIRPSINQLQPHGRPRHSHPARGPHQGQVMIT